MEQENLDKYYCCFDQEGQDIFFTADEKYANLDSLPDKYEKDKCSIHYIECDPKMAYKKDMVTGEITCQKRIRREQTKTKTKQNDPELQTIALQASLLELKTNFSKFIREDQIEDMISNIESKMIDSKLKQINSRLDMIESMIANII